MSHITIIISRVATSSTNIEHEPSYEYTIPVPHGATSKQVAELTRKAFKRLEGAENDDD